MLDVAERVRRAVLQTPDRIALRCGAEMLTYRELGKRQDSIGTVLREAGVGPGSCVVLQQSRGSNFVLSVLATLGCGSGYIPGSPRVIDSLSALAARFGRQLFSVDDQWNVERVGRGEAILGPSERAAYLLPTSGSTGRSKIVEMPVGALNNMIAWQTRSSAEVSERPTTLAYADFSFDVSVQEILSTLTEGATLVVATEAQRREFQSLVVLIREAGVQRVFLPYSVLRGLARVARAGEVVLGSLAEVVTAGEQPYVDPLVRSFFQDVAVNARLVNQYGPTETHVVTQQVLVGDPADWPEVVPMGRPITGVDVELMGRDGAAVRPGEVGEIVVSGLSLASGYVGDEALTTERFRSTESGSRCFRTGDFAAEVDGRLRYLGRVDGRTKSDGVLLSLSALQARMLRAFHPRYVSVDVVRTDYRDRVTATVHGIEMPSDAEVRHAVMAEFGLNFSVTFTNGEPTLSANGKAHRAGAATTRPPDSAVEEIVREAVGFRVDATMSPADVGLSSLEAAVIAGLLRSRLGLILPSSAVLNVTRLADLVGMAQDGGRDVDHDTVAEQRDCLPAETALWMAQQIAPDSGKVVLEVDAGPMGQEILETALVEVVRANPVLRSRVSLKGGTPRLYDTWPDRDSAPPRLSGRLGPLVVERGDSTFRVTISHWAVDEAGLAALLRQLSEAVGGQALGYRRLRSIPRPAPLERPAWWPRVAPERVAGLPGRQSRRLVRELPRSVLGRSAGQTFLAGMTAFCAAVASWRGALRVCTPVSSRDPAERDEVCCRTLALPFPTVDDLPLVEVHRLVGLTRDFYLDNAASLHQAMDRAAFTPIAFQVSRLEQGRLWVGDRLARYRISQSTLAPFWLLASLRASGAGHLWAELAFDPELVSVDDAQPLFDGFVANLEAMCAGSGEAE